MLFVAPEIDENNYFDNGFTPLGWKPLCEFYTVCISNDYVQWLGLWL